MLERLLEMEIDFDESVGSTIAAATSGNVPLFRRGSKRGMRCKVTGLGPAFRLGLRGNSSADEAAEAEGLFEPEFGFEYSVGRSS